MTQLIKNPKTSQGAQSSGRTDRNIFEFNLDTRREESHRESGQVTAGVKLQAENNEGKKHFQEAMISVEVSFFLFFFECKNFTFVEVKCIYDKIHLLRVFSSMTWYRVA